MSAPSSSPASSTGVRADDDGRYFEHARPELRALVPAEARRVLDVGCGGGALGGALRAERGIEVCGVELFAEAAARAAELLDRVVVADLRSYDGADFAPGSFDAVICGDVLEHLHDPHRLVRVLRGLLTPGGTLVCSIPNVKHWSVLYPLLVQDRWRYEDAGLLDRTHVHFFTLEEIGELLQATGFTPVSVGANVIALPPELEALVDVAARLGAEREETRQRLGAYQYLVAATPSGPS